MEIAAGAVRQKYKPIILLEHVHLYFFSASGRPTGVSKKMCENPEGIHLVKFGRYRFPCQTAFFAKIKISKSMWAPVGSQAISPGDPSKPYGAEWGGDGPPRGSIGQKCLPKKPIRLGPPFFRLSRSVSRQIKCLIWRRSTSGKLSA